jgi:hypothetical protein
MFSLLYIWYDNKKGGPMDETQRNTLDFCFTYVLDHLESTSQNNQCRKWLGEAMKIIEKENLDAGPMILSELSAADDFLSGKALNMTSVDARTKIDTAQKLCI